MKSSKWYSRDDPVFIRIGLVEQDDDHRNNQEDQYEAPAFPNLYQHFIQVILDVKASNDKWNHQKGQAKGNPDAAWQCRKRQLNFRQDIVPMQLVSKIQNEY